MGGNARMEKKTNYRKAAFEKYGTMCVHCGFGIYEVLQIAHIDQNNKNHDLKNLVPLCPTCHRMLDINLISKKVILEMRDRPKKVKWDILFKLSNEERKEIAKKAWGKRKGKNKETS